MTLLPGPQRQPMSRQKAAIPSRHGLDTIFCACHISSVSWEIEFSDPFGQWWESLSSEEQESVAFGVGLLEKVGPALSRPYVDTLNGSRFRNMKELRIQHDGRPLRVLFAFDPRRVALLLLGGDKTGDNRWYEKAIQTADAIYAEHLENLSRPGRRKK